MKKILVYALFIMLFQIPIIVFAHSIPFEVGYDKCIKTEEISEDYKWYKIYELYGGKSYSHLSNNVQTVKYWIENINPYSGYTWTSDISEDTANEIKNAYIESIMKWNDVYYYSYDNGVIVSNKVINIEPAESLEDANLLIYPSKYSMVNNFIGATSNIGSEQTDLSDIGNYHYHYYKYKIEVTVDYFYEHNINVDYLPPNEIIVNKSQALLVRERNGAHEFGHVLGLEDIDIDCDDSGYDDENNHHTNVIMGYGKNELRTTNITYQDIAGVSITRGFHTDNDHIWMKRVNEDKTIDLICAQCNGILYNVYIDKETNTYQGKELKNYKSCTHYGGSNEKMLLVATNGIQDFYKCQYCRHIEIIEKVNGYDINLDNSFHINYGMVPNKKEIYELNITEQNDYIFNFTLRYEYKLNIKLYDQDFKEIYIYDINKTQKNYHYVKNLSPGKYFIEIRNFNIINYINGYIFSKENSVILNNECNNLLTSQYNNKKEYYLNNTQGVGIYKISLNGKYQNGSDLNVMNESIKLYNKYDREELYYSLSSDFSEKVAQNDINENTIYVYLPENNLYYIDINLPDDDYLELNLNIEKVIDSNEISLNNESNLLLCNEFELVYDVNEKNEWFKNFKINEAEYLM